MPGSCACWLTSIETRLDMTPWGNGVPPTLISIWLLSTAGVAARVDIVINELLHYSSGGIPSSVPGRSCSGFSIWLCAAISRHLVASP